MTYIHPSAKIGQGVTIEPFAYVAGDVEIGDGTWIGPHAVIMDGARVGKNCRIFPGAVISGVPQDLKFDGEITTAEIGDNTTIRECVTVNRGTRSRGKTVIGSNCLVMSYVHVAHDSIIGNYCILGGYTGLAGEVEVDDHAIVSGGSLVHQFVRIGKHVMIQGGSKIVMDVPPFIMAGRDPLSFAGLNSVGLKRRQFSPEKINEIHDMYRVIYQRGLNNTNALDIIEKEIPASPERDEVVNFIRSSKRGIIKRNVGDKTEE